ncbi:hypothetical protein BVX99_02710 [bacterium F16]|nr:hypothetical protein BVX99_02710 [bacterium F16]
MAKKKRKVHDPGECEPPMSAMIDVVFLLLIFFIVTYQEPMVEAHMAINMPSPNPPPNSEPPPPPLEIWVLKGDKVMDPTTGKQRVDGRNQPVFKPGSRYLMMGRSPSTLKKIEEELYAIVANNPKQAVMIKVQQVAPEGNLVDLLDLCSKVKLTNLNVLTLKEGYNR